MEETGKLWMSNKIIDVMEGRGCELIVLQKLYWSRMPRVGGESGSGSGWMEWEEAWLTKNSHKKMQMRENCDGS